MVIILSVITLNAFGWQVSHSHGSIVGDKPTVKIVVFLATDCPISQKYLRELNRIVDQYSSSDLSLLGFVPGKISKKDLNLFKEEYQIRFKISADKNYHWVKKLKANVTPEVFVFDANGVIRYQGAIDNWFYELGSHRQEITEKYLTNAIDALLHGNGLALTKTEAVGCIIQVPSKK